MKIKISEIESHEINLPVELDKEGFLGLLIRLNAIGKMISKDDAGELSNKSKEEIAMDYSDGVYKPFALNSPIKEAGKKNFGNKKWGLKKRGYHMNKKTLALLRRNRDIVVKLWKAYYKEDSEKKELWALVEKYDLKQLIPDIRAFTSGTPLKIRKELKIQPQEIGLVRFSGRGEKIQRLKNGN